MKHTRWLVGLAALAMAAGLLSAAYLITPGVRRPSLPRGEILVCQEADGSTVLTWPDGGEDCVYLVEITGGDREAQRRQTERPTLTLTGLSLPFRVRIQAMASGTNLMGMRRELVSLTRLDAEVPAAELEQPELRTEAEEEAMTFSWEGSRSPLYAVCSLRGGIYLPMAVSTGTGTFLRFDGGESGLEMPAYGQPLYLALRAGTSGTGYVLYGPPSEAVTVERGDLLGDTLSLTAQETEPGVYALEWTEARGVSYELREWRDGEWRTLSRPKAAERFRYDLGRLPSGSQHRYQVVTRDGNGRRQVEEEVSFYAQVSPRYCTVWPVVDLDFMAGAGDSETLGYIPAGTALCVLEEDGQWFRVRYTDRYGYVDSRYCMIDLPEYLGDYCAYDVPNSYGSIFQVHGSPIAAITGQVIPGFEHIRREEGFWVPYLYPCAQKLLSAAQAALEDGFRLKIYEAFRPNEATRFLYDTAAARLGDTAPVLDGEEQAVDPVSGLRVDLATGDLVDPETGEIVDVVEALEGQEPAENEGDEAAEGTGEAARDQANQPPEGDETDSQEAEETGEAPEDGEAADYPTYGDIMTDNGRFRLGNFLAAVASAHNRGIALDVTLETLEDGRELEMQTEIYDLSWHSAVEENNENAQRLASYMAAAEMRGLSSEWWHFQDDETREAIGLTSYLYKGVNAGGWTRDDRGWRWRDAAGAYGRGTTVTVDGVQYTLDREGYTDQAPAE